MFRWFRLLSIRTKLIWLVAVMFVIPWMGNRYIQEMKEFLLQGQREALLLTASGVATILNEQNELFHDETGVPELVGNPQDLYAHRLQRFVQIDGVVSDWSESALLERRTYTQGNEFICESNYDADDFEVTHLLGYRGSWLYALFQVRDEQLIYRDLDRIKAGSGDHLRILIQNPRGSPARYLVVASKPGRMSAYLVDEDWQTPLLGQAVDEVVAWLREVENGYMIELRLPRYQVGTRARLGFTVVDIDNDESREIESEIASYPLAENNPPGRVLLTSPELTQIVRGLNQPNSRIWVLDSQQRVRAVVGGLSPPSAIEEIPESEMTWWQNVKYKVSAEIDRHISRPDISFEDLPSDLTHRREEMILEVLGGKPKTADRRSVDNRVKIVMAGYPVRSGSSVLGAVMVEQSSHAILASQYKLLKSLAAASLLAFAFVTIMLIAFAWRLTVRIGRLRDTTEQAITREGRVLKEEIPSRVYPRDELGDLGRSITNMLDRLQGYTGYLEGLPDTMAHELNNPLNVVSSSLQNLVQERAEIRGNKYINRAQDGIERLRNILSALTAAANIEEAMQSEDRVVFDLTTLVANYVEGVATVYTSHRFAVDIQAKPLKVLGSGDHLAEMLDKLIDNAVEFSPPDTLIQVSVAPLDRAVELRVANQGHPISDEMRKRVFDPMVSIGRKDAKRTHLGLGLYVVRLIAGFHEGQVQMDNLEDGSGVVVAVTIPRVFD